MSHEEEQNENIVRENREEGIPEFQLEVTTSTHGLPCVEIQDPTPAVRSIIRRAVLTQFMDDPAYKLKSGAGAFLQGDAEDWILVEFWKENYQPFVDYLNEQIAKIQNK